MKRLALCLLLAGCAPQDYPAPTVPKNIATSATISTTDPEGGISYFHADIMPGAYVGKGVSWSTTANNVIYMANGQEVWSIDAKGRFHLDKGTTPRHAARFFVKWVNKYLSGCKK